MDYILIIDDSPTIRASIEFAVKSYGLPIEQAENGVEALEKVNKILEKGDDIIITIVDINMPQMNGIEFIKNFRKICQTTPVIVLTTEVEDSKIQEGKEAGASGWLVKPFNVEELDITIKRFIKL